MQGAQGVKHHLSLLKIPKKEDSLKQQTGL